MDLPTHDALAARSVRCDEIRWRLEPLPEGAIAEADAETLAVAALSEGTGFRRLSVAAVHAVAALHRELAARDRTVAALRTELRALRGAAA